MAKENPHPLALAPGSIGQTDIDVASGLEKEALQAIFQAHTHYERFGDNETKLLNSDLEVLIKLHKADDFNQLDTDVKQLATRMRIYLADDLYEYRTQRLTLKGKPPTKVAKLNSGRKAIAVLPHALNPYETPAAQASDARGRLKRVLDGVDDTIGETSSYTASLSRGACCLGILQTAKAHCTPKDCKYFASRIRTLVRKHPENFVKTAANTSEDGLLKTANELFERAKHTLTNAQTNQVPAAENSAAPTSTFDETAVNPSKEATLTQGDRGTKPEANTEAPVLPA